MMTEEYYEKRNAMKEKYNYVVEVLQAKHPNYTADDLFDMFIAICREGNYGVKDVRIENGKAILIYAEGVEVDFDELKKDYAELKGYSNVNASERGLV